MDVIQSIFNSIKKLLDSFLQFFQPPNAFSWQTLIGLTIFSWAMSYFATGIVENFIANWGWIFLISGVHWATTENKLKIGDLYISPWITGALVCIYLFGSWTDGEIPPIAWVAWPIVSSIIAVLPAFFEEGLQPRLPKPADRQNIVILVGCNLVLSCWIQFHFLIQDWLLEYPSLFTSDFSRSTFVVQLGEPSRTRPRGAIVLDLMETPLKQQLEQQPWSRVERWLLEAEEGINALKEQVKTTLPEVKEDSWWQYSSRVSSNPTGGYNLELIATRQGSNPESPASFATKSCQITPVYPQTTSLPSPTPSPTAPAVNQGTGRVSCQPVVLP